MRFTGITLFPDMFSVLQNDGVVARGLRKNLISLDTVFLRDFALDTRRNVDDHPAGGGDGMVLRADVAKRALDSVHTPQATVILTSPRGKVFSHQMAKELSQKSHLIFLCGRYAGFDERFVRQYTHLSVSIGDFVLSGGELAAMCLIDAIARQVPGLLGNEESAQQDSFVDGLLEPPSYTKPLDFEGQPIPPVLLSGDHKKIAAYQRKEQLKLTAQMRPDLIHAQWDSLTKQEQTLVQNIWRSTL